jgi:hypothetical protein
MPNQSPKRIARPQKPIESLLTGGIRDAMPNPSITPAIGGSMRERVMQQYPYSEQQFTPEELAAYRSILANNSTQVFPDRTDVPASFYQGFWGGHQDMNPGTSNAARQDSLYTAQKIDDALALDRRKMLSDLMSRLGDVFGKQNVHLKR